MKYKILQLIEDKLRRDDMDPQMGLGSRYFQELMEFVIEQTILVKKEYKSKQGLIVTINQLDNLTRDLENQFDYGQGIVETDDNREFQINIINPTPECSDTWKIEDYSQPEYAPAISGGNAEEGTLSLESSNDSKKADNIQTKVIFLDDNSLSDSLKTQQVKKDEEVTVTTVNHLEPRSEAEEDNKKTVKAVDVENQPVENTEQEIQYEKTLQKGINLLRNNPNATTDILQVTTRLSYLRGRLFEQKKEKQNE